ncbi:uncharacterized protein ZK643.6-like [Dendronephthya gigantea]|uniref:uncharacterized protein ZK643.6-like n=1 Tax=Dendronephthya gigantea TaxID=151771 RepID=UPI00106B5369|nr:uncharacterized protein ZK643.6-like [Dendronephthya gigantea]
MATKITVIVLMSIVFSIHAKIMLFEDNIGNRKTRAWDGTRCSKKEDAICSERSQSWCKYSSVRMQCPRLCGVCAPFTGVCPSSYIFGCCWDGSESLTTDKSDCKKCQDTNEKICQRGHIKADCDMQPNTPMTRRLCPSTCGACRDYGN